MAIGGIYRVAEADRGLAEGSFSTSFSSLPPGTPDSNRSSPSGRVNVPVTTVVAYSLKQLPLLLCRPILQRGTRSSRLFHARRFFSSKQLSFDELL